MLFRSLFSALPFSNAGEKPSSRWTKCHSIRIGQETSHGSLAETKLATPSFFSLPTPSLFKHFKINYCASFDPVVLVPTIDEWLYHDWAEVRQIFTISVKTPGSAILTELR